MDAAIPSGELKLAAHVAQPARAAAGPRPALVVCHGFPAGPGGALTSAQTYPDLAEHLAGETGWTVVAFNFRGAGESEGNRCGRSDIDGASISAWCAPRIRRRVRFFDAIVSTIRLLASGRK